MPMSAEQPCIAARPGITAGYRHRCQRPQWRGTDYCYQHAIAMGQAVVVTEQMLVSLFPEDPMLGHRLWRRVKEWTAASRARAAR